MSKIFLLIIMPLFIQVSDGLSQTGATSFKREQCTFTSSSVRFQFLSPTLLRMEYSRRGKFVDAPTVVAIQRNWPEVRLTEEKKKGWLIASTGILTLRYQLQPGPVTKDNLQIEWSDAKGKHSWSPGDTDSLNLGGISSSLDGARTGKLPPFQSGILSRSGYYVLDDSHSPILDTAAHWIMPRPDSLAQDLYFFVYKSDYIGALRQYQMLCGKIPLIPRWTLGAWITDLNYQYLPGSDYVDKYHYTDEDVKGLVTRFRQENIPLDVLVLDFAWHQYGWKGGYDWSPVIPHPNEFLTWMHDNGVKVSANDHPGYGGESVLSDSDSHAAAIRKALNMPIPPPPKISIAITGDWKFRTDPDTSRWRQHDWSAVSLNDSDWTSLKPGMLWEDQGFPGYDGVAWYRKWIDIPPGIPHPLYLLFGGVDDEYDLFINGKKIAHHGTFPYGSVYNSMTWTDISGEIKPGQKNLAALRVNDWGGGGGLSALPVALSDQIPFKGIRFNLAVKQQAEKFMELLHDPVIDQGVDFWWIDGGAGSCEMRGLNSQMWTNKVFFEMTKDHTRKRTFQFSRYGGPGSHRYPGLFTGDTYSEWAVLNYEVPFTAQGGNVLMPYITHDIGGYHNDTISFELYARWLEFGALSPLLRLHSSHENPREGNVRMPWTYGKKGIDLARKYFSLRYGLIPYLYTYCRVVSDFAIPLCAPLYLVYPKNDKCYSHPGEYFLGHDLLVAPVTDSMGRKEVYLPPGQWMNFFSGKSFKGDSVYSGSYAIDETPVFVKTGTIIPMQPVHRYSDQAPLDTLFIECYGDGKGKFNLYEDDGVTFQYESQWFADTPLAMKKNNNGALEISIGPTTGSYKDQPGKRAYRVSFHSIGKPKSISISGKELNPGGWRWDDEHQIAAVPVDATDIRKMIMISVMQ